MDVSSSGSCYSSLSVTIYSWESWRPKASLTQEVIPFCVQVGLIGQAATHDVETVVFAGLQRHLAGTIRAV